MTAYYQNTVWIKKYFYRKEIKCCCSAAIHVNFPHHLYSHRPGGDGVTPWGPEAASAESCTHPAKRDRCFPPPIAERQRLPNVGITTDFAVCCILWQRPVDRWNHWSIIGEKLVRKYFPTRMSLYAILIKHLTSRFILLYVRYYFEHKTPKHKRLFSRFSAPVPGHSGIHTARTHVLVPPHPICGHPNLRTGFRTQGYISVSCFIITPGLKAKFTHLLFLSHPLNLANFTICPGPRFGGTNTLRLYFWSGYVINV